jgi:hypothetical protein
LETNMNERISRRSFIRWSATGLGVAAAALPLLGRTANAAPTTHDGQSGSPADSQAGSSGLEEPKATAEMAAADRALERLVAPIAVGTVLGAARVETIRVDERGVGVVTLADLRGRKWDAEICRRATGDVNVRPLAVSKQYSLYLRNNGSGSVPTDENVGRAVLAVGDRVRRNESKVEGPALRSRKELWQAQGFVG